jgi:hypothetical protein
VTSLGGGERARYWNGVVEDSSEVSQDWSSKSIIDICGCGWTLNCCQCSSCLGVNSVMDLVRFEISASDRGVEGEDEPPIFDCCPSTPFLSRH